MRNTPNTPNTRKALDFREKPVSGGPKQALTLIVASLAVSPVLYAGLTYLVPGPDGSIPPPLRTGLLVVAVIATILGPVVERFMLDRATAPNDITIAVIISGALAEVSAILGLVAYLIAGQREWAFFLLSLLAYVRLFMRLPEFHRLMDEKSP